MNTHEQKYKQLADQLSLDETQYILSQFLGYIQDTYKLEKIIDIHIKAYELYQLDDNLNNVPLKNWDSWVYNFTARNLALSEKVCLAKYIVTTYLENLQRREVK